MLKILPQSFYQRATKTVARSLLGTIIICHWRNQCIVAIICETEAYHGLIDPASHAYRGQTNRNKAMFGPVGHTYVYISYGIHHCLNIVSRNAQSAAGGVLIRGLLLIEKNGHIKHINGPGNVGKLLHLTLADNGIDVTKKGKLSIAKAFQLQSSDIQATRRIGISKAVEKEWRFVITKEKLDEIKEQMVSHPIKCNR